jgi:single-stranded-DNA-specific exonuclease
MIPLLNRRWTTRPVLGHEILDAAAPVAPLQAQVLYHRGVTEVDQMRRWLEADPALVGDPFSLPDMTRAVERLFVSIERGETICIVGDCDVDGLTATAILIEALRWLGARAVFPLVVPRQDDGRGLTQETARRALALGAHLVVTVDNGSASVDETAMLRAAGIDVIITDHHHLPQPSPAALALVNPQCLPESDDRRDLCGAGVAWHVARALLASTPGGTAHAWSLVDLAGLGTMADVVPLTAENHAIAVQGLRRMSQAPRPGLRALAEQSGSQGSATFTPHMISYIVAPRLNAAGRLGDPHIALDLLLAIDPAVAAQTAARLTELNAERQRQTETVLAEAIQLAQQQADAGEPIIFVMGRDWPAGLIGLAAGRLAEAFDRLAVAVSCREQRCRGSLRGPAWFHIAEELARITPVLEQSGGHAQAGGFTTTSDRLADLRRHLSEAFLSARDTSAGHELPPLAVDAVIPLRHISWERSRLIQVLEPYGPLFPEPLFASTGVRILRAWSTGSDRHLKFVATHNGCERTFFWPRSSAHLSAVRQLMGQPLTILWHMPTGSPWSEHPEPLVVALSDRPSDPENR